jgi:TonB family protein
MNHPRWPALSRIACGVLLLCAGGGMPLATAQTNPAADPKFAPAAERAHQEGDKVFKWIMINGSLPKRAGQASAAEPAASAAPVARRPPAPRPESKPESPAAAGTPRERTAANSRKAAAQPAAASAAASGAAIAQDKAPAVPSLPPSPPSPQMPSAEALADATPPQPQEDEPLILVHEVEPDFPAAIVRRQQKGSVLVRFDVETDGSVTQPEVERSTNPRLNAAALQAVGQWKFKPLRRKQTGTVELAFDVR